MELMECILRRRSGRLYTAQPIAEQDLQEILTAGLLSPSSRNLQSAEFITVADKEKLAQLAKAKVGGSGMLKEAACAVVVIGKSAVSDAWIEDGSIAMTQMMLRATELGIANCWVQYRNRFAAEDETGKKPSADENVRNLLNIPEEYSVLAALSLGMPAAENAAHKREDADFAKVHHESF